MDRRKKKSPSLGLFIICECLGTGLSFLTTEGSCQTGEQLWISESHDFISLAAGTKRWCSRTLIYFMIQAESSQSESQNHSSSNNACDDSRPFLTHVSASRAAPLTPPRFSAEFLRLRNYLLAPLLVNENRKLEHFTNNLISSSFQLCFFSSGLLSSCFALPGLAGKTCA